MFGGISYADDLKTKATMVEKDVASVELCARYSLPRVSHLTSQYVLRMCSLGSACDMFFVEFQGNVIKCRYIPHTSLKTQNMMDFITFTGNVDKEMYVLQCSQGLEKSLVDNTDWFTHHKGDWTGRRITTI